jgi:hypothetical protein
MADAGARDGTGAADAPGADVLVLGAWETPTPIEITPVSDDDPTATADLLELYFNRGGDIYMTTRASKSDAWLAPVLVTELSTADPETTPEVTYDGLTMYLARAPATGGIGLNDIFVSTRTSRAAAWRIPTLVPELSSTTGDGAATLIDPLVIMIDSERGGTLDVFVATRATASATFDTPTAVFELNSAQNEGNPMLGAGLLTVYFDSNRSGDNELYVAKRATARAPFGAPAPIVELANAAADSDPWISPDGRTMYFTSNRDGTLRLWQTTR